MLSQPTHFANKLNNSEKRLARSLIKILRHAKPADPGISEDGYVNIDNLLKFQPFKK